LRINAANGARHNRSVTDRGGVAANAGGNGSRI
jgi:hypothetical protein